MRALTLCPLHLQPIDPAQGCPACAADPALSNRLSSFFEPSWEKQHRADRRMVLQGVGFVAAICVAIVLITAYGRPFLRAAERVSLRTLVAQRR